MKRNRSFTGQNAMLISVKACQARIVAKTDDTETYEFERPTKFRTAIRQHCDQNVWRREQKTLSLVDDKREWFEDGSSYPLYVYVPDRTVTDDIIPSDVSVSSALI